MVLVDTSAWIRALMGKQPFREELDALLDRELVLGHEFIYGELLIGDPGGRRLLLAAYSQWRFAPTVPNADVVELVRARRLHGRGIGWVDAQLLASTLVAGATLYTSDAALISIAEELEVLHMPT